MGVLSLLFALMKDSHAFFLTPLSVITLLGSLSTQNKRLRSQLLWMALFFVLSAGTINLSSGRGLRFEERLYQILDQRILPRKNF